MTPDANNLLLVLSFMQTPLACAVIGRPFTEFPTPA